MGDGELPLAGPDRERGLRLPRGLLPLRSPLLGHVLQLLQPFLRARNEARVADFQRFLPGAKGMF